MAIRQNVSGDCYEWLVSGRIDGAAANAVDEILAMTGSRDAVVESRRVQA